MPKKTVCVSLSAGLVLYEFALILWLWLGQPPEWIRVNFYSLSWWPFLILAQSLAQLLWGHSLLYDNPKNFAWICLFSIPFWTSYEILNAVMKNWIYIGLPTSSLFLRWLGFALAYASVLPAIRVYLDLLNPKIPNHLITPPAIESPRLSSFGILLGLAQFALCVVNPTTFYPLAWGFLFFLTEPLVARDMPERSYLIHWVNKRWDLTLKTVMAGLLAGITWEFLNWKASAKWIYTIPEDVAIVKIFEMPLLGFVGFGAFALCAESFTNLVLSYTQFKITDKSAKRQLRKAGITLGAIVSVLGFALIDLYTWIK